MNLRRITASIAMIALLLGTTAVPALAEKGSRSSEKSSGNKVSDKFKDMDEFEWGLNEVTKMTVKGVFKGRDEGIFAPGAKITHQEAAVAVVRLMDKEAEAKALTAAEVSAQLAGIIDADKIDDWAKPSVAMLVKAGALSASGTFKPLDDATRLDIAVLLVSALGYKSEAEAKMGEKLEFKDAKLIPAELVGYVKVAVDHKLITGYDDKTFRPHQAVKRVEMAVMLGRADRLIDKEKEDEIKGVVKSVDAANNSFVVKVGDKVVTLTLAAEASIFIDSVEKELAKLAAGMQVEAKLNGDGKVIYIEAKTTAAPQDPTVTGAVTHLAAATPTALALVSIGNVAYPLSPRAVITLNGTAAAFADLQVGDTVKASTTYGLIVKLQATRAIPVQTVSGTILAVTAATQSALAKVTLSVTNNGTTTSADYVVAANAVVKINGQASQLAGLRVTDTATLSISNNLVTRIDVQRTATTVSGTISALLAASAAGPAKITVTFPSLTTPPVTAEYALAAGALIKINGQAAQFSDLQVNENVTLTLGAGLVDKVEVTRQAQTVSGTIMAITAATQSALAKVTLSVTNNGTTTSTEYVLAPNAVVKLNGQPVQLAALRLTDTATLSISNNLVTRIDVQRTATTVSGTITTLLAASATAPAKITVTFPSTTTPAVTAEYVLAADAVIKINGQAAPFSDLKVNENVTLTLGAGLVDKVEVTRAQTVIQGSIISISMPSAGQSVPAGTVGLVGIIYTSNGAAVMNTYPVTSATQILVNAQAAQFANLQLGDTVKATFQADLLVKLEITR